MIPSTSSGLPVGGSTGTNPPTVSAGSDQQVAAGTVNLTGTAQTGSTVLWTVTRASDGGSVSVTNSTSTSASFTGVQGQSYTATLTATLGGVSAQDSITIAVAATAVPTFTITQPDVSQSGLAPYVIATSTSGATSYAWTGTRTTAAGVESDGAPDLDSTTIAAPTLTPQALGDVYRFEGVATNAGGSVRRSVMFRALIPDAPTVSIADPVVFRSGLTGFTVTATPSGQDSIAWTCSSVSASGTEVADASAALSSTTIAAPTLTPTALGITYLLTCTVTNTGGTATASALVTVLDPDKLTWTEIDLSTYSGSLRAGSGSGNQIDLDTSTLTTGGSTLGHGAVAATSPTTQGELIYTVASSFTMSSYLGLAVKLVHGALPDAGILRGLGVGISASSVWGWSYMTSGNASRVSAQVTSSGLTTSPGTPTPGANDLDTAVMVFGFGNSTPRSLTVRGQAGSTIRSTAQVADPSAGYSETDLKLALAMHDAASTASTFPGVRVYYALIPLPT